MQQKTLKVALVAETAILPSYAHAGDSGLDLCSIELAALPPGARKLIRTGLAVELPSGTEAQIRPRSGLAVEHGITVLNSPGTIDNGYRGEICVLLVNLGQTEFSITPGMKIAQLVVAPVLAVDLEITQQLSVTVRGDKGFGSTG
jgi:dUTP pyrophosphatase